MAPDPERPLEHFDLDTSAYFEGVRSEERISLPECLTSEAPRFYDNGVDVLRLVEGSQREVVVVWRVSPVAFAPDGQHALLVGAFSCGGLCGGGAYYLFERVNGEWTLLGHQGLWVS
ncbi:hypothetical protein [Terricaulis silvestris]|nr:hypothetical protein [Terricaulis silvestris]